MTNSFAVNKVIRSLAIASLLYAEGLLGSIAAHATIPTVLANPQIVLFVPVSTVNQLASKDYKVNVNVFSGRRSSQDNLLACDFFDGKISKIQPDITLKCGLIGEYTSQYINSSSSPVPENSSRPANAVRGLW